MNDLLLTSSNILKIFLFNKSILCLSSSGINDWFSLVKQALCEVKIKQQPNPILFLSLYYI